MSESLEGLKFSTRLKSALRNMADFPGHREMNLEDAMKSYRKDPQAFQLQFLRQPGAGRISLNEFIDWMEQHPGDGDYTGRVTAIDFEEAADLQDELNVACNSIDASSTCYRALRRLQSLLDAATLHIEQVEDDRPMFRKGG
jgi:hypothetical protein